MSLKVNPSAAHAVLHFYIQIQHYDNGQGMHTSINESVNEVEEAVLTAQRLERFGKAERELLWIYFFHSQNRRRLQLDGMQMAIIEIAHVPVKVLFQQ